jgi:hypothetical protein
MQARVLWFPFVSAVVLTAGLWISPAFTQAQNAPAGPGRNSRDVGAPQVLEIPVQSTQPSGPVETPSQLSDFGDLDPNRDWSSPAMDSQFPDWSEPSFETAELKRTYLGVLYATAEKGPEGVQVLSVIEGSPADRSGFEGVNTPARDTRNDFMKVAIVALALSPAGPFVMPLAIAHDIYKNRHPPGDLIVAVENDTVRNAQEFTAAMRRYQPGDRVSFTVLRKNQPLQMTVTLEEEPLSP